MLIVVLLGCALSAWFLYTNQLPPATCQGILGRNMTAAVVLGASGGLGAAFVSELLKSGLSVTAVTRNPASPEILREINASCGRLRHEQVNQYTAFVSPADLRYLFFAQGMLVEAPLVGLPIGDVEDCFRANVVEPIVITRDVLEAHVDGCLDLVYIGSTASYTGASGLGIYSATKFALRGFVESMNAEYAGSQTRFSLVSMGAMNTRMGREHANQHGRPHDSLMEPLDVAKRVVSGLLRQDGIVSTEMMLRLR